MYIETSMHDLSVDDIVCARPHHGSSGKRVHLTD